MSKTRFMPVAPYWAAPEPEAEKAQVRNRVPSKRPLTRAEQAKADSLIFKTRVALAEARALRERLESAGLAPSREQMVWNTRQRYMPVSPYWLGTPGDTRS